MKLRTALFVLSVLLVAAVAFAAGTTEEGATGTETMELTVELFDRNNVPADQGTLEENRWTEWIQEEMLKQGVEVSFFPVPRGEEQSKLNVLMGSGSAPDIVFTYNRFLFAKYALDGGLNDLSDELAEHGPNLERRLGEDLLSYGVLDGKQYAIPARRSSTAHRTSFIRTDWLDILGLDMPTNREELVEVLKAFKEQDPGNIGTDRVIPWGYFPPESSEFEPHSFRSFNAMYSFMEDDEKLMYTTPWPLRDGFREFMEWNNMMYKAGLIDPEFATDTDDLAKQKIMNGQVGFYDWSWWGPASVGYGDVYRNLMKNVPGAELAPIEVFQNSEGRYRKTMYPPIGLYNMNPATSDAEVAAIKYMNWMAEEEVGWIMSFGIEGEHYSLQDGVPIPIDPDHNQRTFGYVMGDLRIMWNGPFPVGKEIEDKVTILNNGDLGEFSLASKNMAVQDGMSEIVFNEEIEAWSKHGPELVKAYDEYWVKMVMADDFDAVYAEFMRELEDRGINEVLADREAYYDRYF